MQIIIPVILLLIAAIAFFSLSSESDTAQTSEIKKHSQVAKDEAGKLPEKQLSAVASYLTPNRDEHKVGVTLSLNGSTITAANVSYNGVKPHTPSQKEFDNAYKSKVIGKRIEEVSLSRVGGASLTSDAFNKAVAEIRKKL